MLRIRVPGCTPERVDAAHVAEHLLADIVEMVVLDDVSLRLILRVAPRPAHRNRGVEEIVNVIVHDLVAPALQRPHADRGSIHQPQVVNVIIGDHVLVVLLRVVGLLPRFAEFDSAAAQVDRVRRPAPGCASNRARSQIA